MNRARTDIAIIGAGAVLPGPDGLDGFWQLVRSGHCAASEPPPGRWALDVDAAYAAGGPQPDRVYSRRACFLQHTFLTAAEAQTLGLDPALLAQLDPVFHLALRASLRAWQEARQEQLPPEQRARAAVILGNIVLPTEKASQFALERLGKTRQQTHPLNLHPTGLPAGLVAHALGLGGPAFTLDAACASSLYALAAATRELAAGRIDVALTGGVSRPDALYTQMGFSQLQALSPGGRCAPFDALGDGLVVGEGAVVFVLKRLDDALRAGDRIRGVVRGCGLANDRGGSLLAPDSEGQLRAMRAAYAMSGWRPDDIDWIECHGTGTPLGDTVELTSLETLWRSSDASLGAPGRRPISSVKSNVGHLLTAAGGAGLLKVLLSLQHAEIPPTANISTPSRALAASAYFSSSARLQPWQRRDARTPRRAAVSAFGFGGINAHVLIEEWSPDSPTNLQRQLHHSVATRQTSPQPRAPVAIVGMSASFGPWHGLPALRERLFGKADDAPATSNFALGEVEIDWKRFRIPPRELNETLPQQLVMLETAAAAFDDARGRTVDKERLGVFIGLGLDLNTTNFHARWMTATNERDRLHPALNANRVMGALGGIVASRVARWLQAGGPSHTVSAEEGSALSAVDAARRSLDAGEIDAALVGAVEACSKEAGMASEAGEGAAAWVLKRLDDAVRDGDCIYAVIRGSGTARGSTTVDGLPTTATCERAMEQAFAEAQVDPSTVTLLETSCPPAGDGESSRSAAAQLLQGKSRRTPCALVHSQSRLGFAGPAASAASLVVATLALHDEIIPASAEIGTASEGFYTPTEPRFWLRDRVQGPRRAGVTCLSMQGTVTHVVLEAHESSSLDLVATPGPADSALFGLTARSPEALASELAELRSFAVKHRGRNLTTLAREWMTSHRQEFFGGAVVVRNPGELETVLAPPRDVPGRFPASKTSSPNAVHAPRYPQGGPDSIAGSVAFVFPGSGSQFPGMGRDLARRWPDVLRRLDSENEYFASQMAQGKWWSSQIPAQANHDHEALIFAQVSLGTCVSDLVRSFGIEPRFVIGYSLGESAGLFALRAWRDRDEMLRRMRSSSLFKSDLAGPCDAARRAWRLPTNANVDWTVGLVARPRDVVEAAVNQVKKAYLLIVNAPNECVIGGDREAVEQVLARLKTGWIELEGITTVHCEVAREVAQAYRDLHLFDATLPANVRFYSAARGAAYVPTRDSAADSILAQALDTFDFTRVIAAAHDDGARIFLEMGPGASTSRMIGRILEGRPHAALAACPPVQDAADAFLHFLAACLVEGLPVNLNRLYPKDRIEALPRLAADRLAVRCGPLLAPVPGQTPGNGRTEHPTAASRVAPLLLRARERIGEAHSAFLQAERFGATTTTALLGQARTTNVSRQTVLAPPLPARPRIFLDRNGCLEFAVGSIAKALGQQFAAIESHPTRVRLPDEPLMLVDRIIRVDGAPLSMTSGRVVTEHDVGARPWYLDAGRIPVSIAVEAGQADLFLSGWLGIDLETQGLAVYRLLDAVVTFHRALPRAGEVIRYDIQIENFFRQGRTWLFRFRFDATVDGEPLLTMRKGCAGFFTTNELAQGRGIVRTALDRRPLPGIRPADWRSLTPLSGSEAYSAEQIEALRRGDLAACFGSAFGGLGLEHPSTLPGGRMRLVDRVESLDPGGGRFGLGQIRAQLDIHPDDWFLRCHFVDDQVMPGTLMYECCLHTLRIFLLRLGWVGEEQEVAHEPVPGVSGQLKCRGQVTAATQTVTHEVSIRELGFRPEPYAVADALIYADGKPIVEILGMSLRLTGLSRSGLEKMWTRATARPRRRAIFDTDRIRAFAVGKPSEAFGDRYRVFDSERVIARLPGPPYQFLDRIVDIQDCEPWMMQAGGRVEAEYDVPADAWYFAANGSPIMPFGILLEVALQPCGWLAAYVGSALTSPVDVSFRNLGGNAIQLAAVTPKTGTLTTCVSLSRVSHSGGMIIQNYELSVRSEAGPVYQGTTYFGFFTRTALAQQIGLRDATRWAPPNDAGAQGAFAYPSGALFPSNRLRLVSEINSWLPSGGPAGLGFLRGSKSVDPGEWFFKAHFYQDPVQPGSLGLEAFLQLLKFAAVQRWGVSPDTLLLTPTLEEKHEWIYRGQVVPSNRVVTVEAVITELDDATRTLKADGFLLADGLVIYQMRGFGLECR